MKERGTEYLKKPDWIYFCPQFGRKMKIEWMDENGVLYKQTPILIFNLRLLYDFVLSQIK